MKIYELDNEEVQLLVKLFKKKKTIKTHKPKELIFPISFKLINKKKKKDT